MKHINTKIASLLHEGFSISTLDSLNENQINLLYEKAKKVKKEPKEAEQVTKTITATKYKPEEIAQFKNSDGSYSIPQSEGEVTERAKSKKVEPKEGKETFIQKATKKMESKGTEGKFGRWCKKEGLDSDGEVTKKCISTAMKSDDPAVVKMANFAKNIGGFKGSEHKKKSEPKEDVKKLEEGIMRLIEDYLPPHTTKSELLNAIKRRNR